MRFHDRREAGRLLAERLSCEDFSQTTHEEVRRPLHRERLVA